MKFPQLCKGAIKKPPQLKLKSLNVSSNVSTFMHNMVKVWRHIFACRSHQNRNSTKTTTTKNEQTGKKHHFEDDNGSTVKDDQIKSETRKHSIKSKKQNRNNRDRSN